MMQIQIIEGIDAAHLGPQAPFGEDWQEVHLQQGSLDGACGPYCLFMALIVCGLVDRNQLLSFPRDRRTRSGRLMSQIEKYAGLLQTGTHLTDLERDLKNAFGAKLKTETSAESGKRLRSFVEDQVLAHHQVVVGLDSPKDGHWVLVIGLDYETTDSTKDLHRFLVLDPSVPTPTVSAWNGVIDAYGSGGHYPYRYWGGEHEFDRVQLNEAIALWV